MSKLISVIVATYNRPDALAMVLRSLSRQSDRRFELVVADDGSSAVTARVINEWTGRIGVALKHVWQEDRGFRLAEIRNRAIRASSGDYLVFLDGDCLTRPDFVATHRRLSERGWFVTGNRILLSRELTERILHGDLEPEQSGFASLLTERSRRGVGRFAPAVTLRLPFLHKLHPHRWQDAHGSNMAFWRSDLETVDGFDSAFTGWGREDSDIFVRMIRAKVGRKDWRSGPVVLHLWHPDSDRSRLSENDRHLEALLMSERSRAQRGLSWLIEATKRDSRVATMDERR